MNWFKKIILWFLVVASVLGIYLSAYLPFVKSKKYIEAMNAATGARSVAELKSIFDEVFDFYSPVGAEEVSKFFTNNIEGLINRPEATEDISRDLVEYSEATFASNNVRHMITGARMYETLWRHYGKEEYFNKAENYYKKAYAIGPKLPPVLYGMLGIYYSRRDLAASKNIAEQILSYWPNDERVKNLAFPQ